MKRALLGLALKEAVGEELAARVSLHSFKGGVLWVKVPTPAWASELLSKKGEIIKKINNFYQEKLISDLKTLVYSSDDLEGGD